jgi:hypothetical protein
MWCQMHSAASAYGGSCVRCFENFSSSPGNNKKFSTQLSKFGFMQGDIASLKFSYYTNEINKVVYLF